ncbi:MAG: carboxypeptidase regulatory-like domain-containing protein, partial [Tepidisphaerales bacterium]
MSIRPGRPAKANRSGLRVAMDVLEDRLLLAAATPTDYDQYMLELINQARANPVAEAARYSVALNEGVPAASTISTLPKQPLAFNPFLIDAARGHSQDMIAHDYFGHDSFTGQTSDDRLLAAGYVLGNQGWGSGENIAWRGTTPAVPPLDSTTAQLHQDLFVDAGYDGRGHRINMLYGDFKEVGIGVVPGIYYDPAQGMDYNAVMATIDFAYNANTVFLTGVAFYDDIVPDQFYEPGEGIGGLTITAVRNSDNATFSTTAFSTGGYTIPIEPGTYTVTASGAGVAAPMVVQNVVIGQDNVKVDFIGSSPAPKISGHVYDDLNQDGSYTPGEGLAGLTVTALRTAGGTAVSQSTTTSSDGSYTLDVSPGTYRVTVTGAALDAPIVMQNVAVIRGPVSLDIVKPPPQITGVVYADLNLDGSYTPGEPVFPGATVQATPSAGTPVYATTGADGTYSMVAASGTYTLTASGTGMDAPVTIQNVVVGRRNVKVDFAEPQTLSGKIPDKTPPAAKFAGSKLVTAAATSYKFTVTYSDPSRVKRSTIGAGDLLVTGPKAFKAVKPTFVSAKANVDAVTIIAVYSFVPSGGKWTAALNGTYTVTLNAKQVADTRGNTLARTLALGTFVVSLKKTKTAAKTAAPPGKEWARNDFVGSLIGWHGQGYLPMP